MTFFCLNITLFIRSQPANPLILDGEIIEEEIGEPKNGTPFSDIDMESDVGRTNVMLRLYNATAASDIIVRAKAYEVLNYISTAKYLHLQAYALQLVERTVEGLKTEDNLVVHQILELWMSIAEMEGELEDAGIRSHELVLSHAFELIPAILGVLPSRVSDVSFVEEIVSPPKSIFTAAILTLWLLVEALPESTCMQQMSAFVGKYIVPSQDWRLRKSAIAVLGLLSQLEDAETLVRSCIGLVIEAGTSSLLAQSQNSASSASNSTTTSSTDASKTPAPERNLSLSDSAAFCILQISELKSHLLEDRWESIINWMGALDVTNKNEFVILSSLIDAAISFISFSEEDIDVEAALLPHLGKLTALFAKWTGKKEILQFPRQLISLCNGLETITDLYSEDDQLKPYTADLEVIAVNVLALLDSEDSSSLSPQVAASLISTFVVPTIDCLSFETVQKLVNLCLKRGSTSTNFDELQAILVALICIVTPYEKKFEPFIGSTCDFILKLLRDASFGADDETSLIPVSEIRPQDEEEEEYDSEGDYLGAKPETTPRSASMTPSKRSASGRLISSSSRSTLVTDADQPSPGGSAPGTPSKRKERVLQVHKSKKIAAKNVVLEDAMRLVEPIMNTFTSEQVGTYSKDLALTLLEFALKVPSSFVSLLSTLALSLCSIMRQDNASDSVVELSLRPLLKLIEQITKTIAGDETQREIYHALLTAFQSAIVSTAESNDSHISTLHESFEILLMLLKQANKIDEGDEPDETTLSDSIALIGDYLSRVSRRMDDERIARLKSTFDMIMTQWLEPETETVEYTLGFFEKLAQRKSQPSVVQEI